MRGTLLLPAFVAALAGAPALAGSRPDIAPEAPRIGDTITVRYAGSGPLAGAADVELEALLYRDGTTPVVLEIPMKKVEGGEWSASFSLEDPQTVLVLFRFAAGERIDDLDGSVPYLLVHGADGRPVPGAHYALYMVIRTMAVRENGYVGFRLKADEAEARDHIARERALHPESWRAARVMWEQRLAEKDDAETRASIREELARQVEVNRDDPTAQMIFVHLYRRIGDEETAVRLEQSAIAADPKGPAARAARSNAIEAEKDPSRRAALIERDLDEHPDLSEGERGFGVFELVAAYQEAGQHRKAVEALARQPDSRPGLIEAVADWLIEENVLLEEAAALARRAVAARRSPAPDRPKPASITTQDWRRQQERLPRPEQYLADALLLLGRGLLAAGRPEQALEPLREAYGLVGRDPGFTLFVEHFMLALGAVGRDGEAAAVGLDAVREGRSTETILQRARKAWMADGSRRGWSAALARARDELRASIRAALPGSRLDRPAPDFSATRWDGSPVSLASMKGKIVVLEFWTST